MLSSASVRFLKNASTRVASSMRPNKFPILRTVTTNSWAADRMQEQGIKVDKVPQLPDIIVEEKMLDEPSEKVLDLGNRLLKLNMAEYSQMLNIIDKRLGFEGMLSGGGSGGAAPAEAAPVVEAPKEKEAFDIKIGAVDAKAKIKIIKEVRAMTGLGLKEAKDLVEKAPTVIKQGLKKEEAESLKKILEEAGAVVELL